MKKLPKILQADKRGQIVIPKEIRQELGIDETTGFHAYTIGEKGILLKKIENPDLEHDKTLKQLTKNSEETKITKKDIEQTKQDYKHNKGGLEEL